MVVLSKPDQIKPYLLQVLEDLCPKFGATLYVEPNYGYAGYLEFPSGRRRFFHGASFDVNRQGAAMIARDKDYCAHFLRKEGFQVPESVLVFSPGYRAEMELKNSHVAKNLPRLQAALDFLSDWGFPVFVKPNEGSEGKGVQLVGSFDALFDALFALFKENPRVLVQRPVGGRDYRVVVLDDEVISAYERLPLRVTGDGVNTLGSLASSKIEALGAPGRGPKVARSDPRIGQNIAAQGWAFDDVVAVGKVIDLLPNANLSTGGEARDITGAISPGLKKVCRSATRTLGLTFAGVDIRSEDATDEHADYTILEVNAAPGLHNFATLGAAQEENVRMLYAKLMAYLAKNS